MGSYHLWTSLVFCYLTAVLCNPANRVTLERPSAKLHPGDTVTLRCVGSDMEDVELYNWDKKVEEDSSHQITRTETTVELRISPMSHKDIGSYACAKNGTKVTGESSVGIFSWNRGVTLRTSSELIPDQGYVTLTCSASVKNCQWFRQTSSLDTDWEMLQENSPGWAKTETDEDRLFDTASITVSRGGVYSAKGVDWMVITEKSNDVTILEIGLPLQMPSWAYPGDTLTIQCVGPEKTSLHFYKDGVIVKNGPNHVLKRTNVTTMELKILSASASDKGMYSCGTNNETLYSGQELQMHPEPREKSSLVFVLMLVGGILLAVLLILLLIFDVKRNIKERNEQLQRPNPQDSTTPFTNT